MQKNAIVQKLWRQKEIIHFDGSPHGWMDCVKEAKKDDKKGL